MFEKVLVMYIYAETPIHPGSGATLGGVVDLPIQRERHTEFPMIQGSSLKGVLRSAPKGARKGSSIALSDECENCPKKEGNELKEACSLCGQIFGREDEIGGISVTDARILAFPVRTLKGVFGWVTCPLVLERYKRDLSIAGNAVNWEIPKPSADVKARICKGSNLIVDNHIYIEDLQLECEEDDNVSKIAKDVANALPSNNVYDEIRKKIEKDLVVISDDVFRDLVSLTTEVTTRIRISPETGTVVQGALWSEEYLPTDTIMYSLILIPSRPITLSVERLKEDLKKKVEGSKEVSEKIEIILEENYNGKVLQIGGDETIGKGFAMIKLARGGENAKES